MTVDIIRLVRRTLPKVTDKSKHDTRFERTPDGTINNCALANGDEESNCQMCRNACPDRGTRFPIAEQETEQGESLDEALNRHSKTQPKARERSKTSGATVDRDSLSLGEMGRIVERVFKFDFDAAYEAVMTFLKPGDDRRLDLGFLQNELDRSVEMAALAHRLFTNAREACEIFEIDRDVIQTSMREEARYKLEEDLRRKTRLKPITDTDVLGMMKMQDPAKWRDLRVKSVRMTATRDHLERIADLARKRIDTLSTLVEKKR